MFGAFPSGSVVKNTTHKVVVPFYLYASLSFLVSTVLLLLSTEAFTQHYFHPHILALTHGMALGWGTMIILGASHQLVPVLIEKSLHSVKLAHASFWLAAIGIPLLVYGFFVFNMGWPAKWGGRFVLLSVICYFINLCISISKSKSKNVHAYFVLAATAWLLLTVFYGLSLVYNFTYNFMPKSSVAYLPIHAHTGVIGWFLLLIVGVGSRLIPLFLISKYKNDRLLWIIFFLINAGLISFVLIFLFAPGNSLFMLPVIAVLLGLMLFAVYCYKCYKHRIRKQVDEQVKISLLSVLMMLIPLIFLVSITGLLFSNDINGRMALIYGFIIFFGWITAIILGMTFKTLPFIIWNKVYHDKAGLGKTPNPKDLFKSKIFSLMVVTYLGGFVLFITAAAWSNVLLLNIAAIILIVTAVLYNMNVFTVVNHKAKML